MKIEDVKVGMKVRIRQWDDMEKEYGLDSYGDIAVAFGFSCSMRSLCGKHYTVNEINYFCIKLDGLYCKFSADMLEPVIEEFTLPPPPDLGELRGVKLPAWMWSKTAKKRVYLLCMQFNYGLYPVVVDGKLRHITDTFLEPYTGQDLPPKLSVDELKSLARLV